MADALQTPQMAPRHVITALAHRVNPNDLVQLDPRVQPGNDGWSLIWKDGKKLGPASERLAQALDIPLNVLRTTREADRIGSLTRHAGNEMIHYLVWRDYSNEPNAPALPGEHLIIAPPMSSPGLFEIFDKLNRHATCIRASILTRASGDDLTLFHIRGDDRRGSTLAQFLTAYQGGPAPILNAYQTTSGTAFLPVAPPARSLASVAQLIAQVPTLFAGLVTPRLGWAPEALLFAVVRGTDVPSSTAVNEDTFFDIRAERFFGRAKFISDQDRPKLQFAQSVTSPDMAVQKLKDRLVRPDSTFAAPLTLRRSGGTFAMEEDARRLNELLGERRALDRRIRAAEATIAGHSVMIVAKESAFKAVAKLLRQIVGSNERFDDIRYSFLDSGDGKDAPEPRHVFHFGPRSAQLARLNATLGAYDEIDFFWSDPGWTANYGRNAQIEVVVPLGQRLSPLPQSSAASEMDAFLIDMVSTWSHGEIDLANSQRHVLQFVPDPEGGPPNLEVFAAEQLHPLDGRAVTWFNAVMAQSRATAQDAERLRDEDYAAREDVAQQRRDREDAQKADMQAATKQSQVDVQAAWAAFGAELTDDLTNRMDGIAERAKAIRAIEEDAIALEDELKTARALLEAATKDTSVFAAHEKREIDGQTQTLSSFVSSLGRRAQSFDGAVSVSNAKIDQMRKTLDEIRRNWFK